MRKPRGSSVACTTTHTGLRLTLPSNTALMPCASSACHVTRARCVADASTTTASYHLPQGYAVRCGIAAARGQHILFADADGATPVAEVEKLEAELKRVLAPDAGLMH